MKTILRELIIEFHKDTLPDLMQRAIEIPLLPLTVRKAIVFIGMRRVGKTYLLYQHMKHLLAQGLEKYKLFYINFEDDRLDGFTSKDFQTLLNVYFELYPQAIFAKDLYFYFDEIQNIDGWEKFIRRLIDKEKMKIFITGSSAKLLSKEIATHLRGRCLVQEVFPLSFREYLDYHNTIPLNKLGSLTQKDSAVIKNYSQSYLARGGFPETLDLSDSLAQQIIQSYVNATVFRDVIERYQLTNPHIVKLFLMHCLQHIAAPLSVTKVFNTLKSRGESLGRASLYTYLNYFEDAYLLFNVPIFELSARKRQVNPSKIYCVDQSIILAYSMKPQMEHAAQLENAVYMHLRRQQYDAIYFYKTTTGKEVDFIAQHINGKLELYQVCYDLNDNKTLNREISALIEAAETLQLNEAWIITLDKTETIANNDCTIHIVPYWQWVL